MATTLERRTVAPWWQRARRTVERWLFESPLWLLVAASLIVSLILFGYDALPHAALSARQASDPWTQVAGSDPIASSPLGPILAWMLHATGTRAFVFTHFVAVVASLATVAWTVAHWAGDFAARLIMLAWTVSPLPNVMLTWLGYPDPFTLLGATLVAVGPPGVVLAAATLLGFNHFEQGAFIILFAVLLRPSRSVRIAAVTGLLAGRALLLVYQQSAGLTGGGRGRYVADEGVGHLLELTARNLPTAIWSGYAVLWVPVIVMLCRVDRRQSWLLIGMHCVAAAAVAITVDTTRVWALLTWPIVIWTMLWWARNDAAACRRWAVPLLVAAIVIPRVNVWGGEVLVR